MLSCDILIRNARMVDGSGGPDEVLDIAVCGDRISDVGPSLAYDALSAVDAGGLVLAPGFIDVHTHDDTHVIRAPSMLPKISQGVTTVIVGNCGISAAPVQLRGALPDPMNLLGDAGDFRYPTFASYIDAIQMAQPAVNVGALVGHTALRNNHMDRLDRHASEPEIAAMRVQLQEALDLGALGLSTGLAYRSANAATTEEVLSLAGPLAAAGAVYTTHMRTEANDILLAMDEAFTIGRMSRVPLIISHLKCAGIDNWGRSGEVLGAIDRARTSQPVGCDCYPYAAGSSTLDLKQVDARVKITITWSKPHPELAGQTLAEIAGKWDLPIMDTAIRLQPAGAIYHSISEQDMRRILQHSATMIGSDGLPNDPLPHPRLWGTFPRVLGRYCRDEQLLTLPQAIHKMTQLPARRFGLPDRGLIRKGCYADLVLLDLKTINDRATYSDSMRPAEGILGVWVNGKLSYTANGPTEQRAGRFLTRGKPEWIQ